MAFRGGACGCPIVAFRSAKERAFFRGAKDDNRRVLQTNRLFVAQRAFANSTMFAAGLWTPPFRRPKVSVSAHRGITARIRNERMAEASLPTTRSSSAMTVPIWLTRCHRPLRLRYSLRTLLLAVLAFNVGCAGWLAYQRHRRAVLENETLATFGNDGQSYVVQGIDDDGTEVCSVFAGHRSIDDVLNLPNVAVLRLVGATDDDLALVASLDHLRELSIESDAITDEGLRRLSSLNRLTALSVHSNGVNGSGLATVVSAVRLQALSLQGVQFDPGVVQSFRREQSSLMVNLIIPTPASWGTSPRSQYREIMAANWLARQQEPDGSWSVPTPPDHIQTLSKVEATAFALVPFMVHGVTQSNDGPYSKMVNRGLHFLASQRRPCSTGCRFGDSLSAHAIATIVLCDDCRAHDPEFSPLALEAVQYIIAQQDAQTGGWSDAPGKAVDNVTTCWQILALRSAVNVGVIPIPRQTIRRARMFVNKLQFADLDSPSAGVSLPTAAGILAGMKLGWGGDNSRIHQFSRVIAQFGPSHRDPQLNLMTRMIMHMLENADFDKFNWRCRGQMNWTVSVVGPEAGSWLASPAMRQGGRLTFNGIQFLGVARRAVFSPLNLIWTRAALTPLTFTTAFMTTSHNRRRRMAKQIPQPGRNRRVSNQARRNASKSPTDTTPAPRYTSPPRAACGSGCCGRRRCGGGGRSRGG